MSRLPIKNGTTGALSELLVAADMMRQGYDVFRAESPHAPFDLVAYRDSAFTRVEVRTVNVRADGSPSPSVKPTDICDLYAFVSHDGRIWYVLPEDARKDARYWRGVGGSWRAMGQAA